MTFFQKAAVLLALSSAVVFWAAPVSAEPASDFIIESISEAGYFPPAVDPEEETTEQVDPNTGSEPDTVNQDPLDLEALGEAVAAANSEGSPFAVVAVETLDPSPRDFFDAIFAETEAQVGYAILPDGPVAIVKAVGETEDEGLEVFRQNHRCALMHAELVDDPIAAFVEFADRTSVACIPPEPDEPEAKDRFGAEGLKFVVEETSDDGVYVGDERSDVNEQALIAAVEQVRNSTGLRLIVAAPDNVDASAFATRLQQNTDGEVLVFSSGQRAQSAVSGDKIQDRDAAANRYVKRQACATQAAWRQSSEAEAVRVFGDHLANGCPFTPPKLILFVLGGLIFLAGILGLVMLRERETVLAKKNKKRRPPTSDDLVLRALSKKEASSPDRSDVAESTHT